MSWSNVQSGSPALDMGTSTTITKPYAANVASGNLLLVQAFLFVSGVSSAQTWTITDSRGNTWVKLADTYGANGQIHYVAWGALSNGAGADNVTIGWTNAATVGDLSLAEFAGIASGVTQDGTVATASSAVSPVVTPSYTPGTTGDLVLSAAQSSGSVSLVNSPWNVGDELTLNTGSAWGWLPGTTSPVTPNFTQSGNADAQVYGILATGTGGGGPGGGGAPGVGTPVLNAAWFMG